MASPAIASPVGGGGPRKSIGPSLAALPRDAVATSVSFRRWGLGFRQSSFRLIKRALRGDASGVFGRSPASRACCCSLRLSPSGKPDGPGTSLRVPPGCARDSAPRSAAHTRRLTRLLSWLPLVTGASRSGLCCTSLPVNRIMAVAMQQLEVRPSVVLPVPILVMPFDQVVSRQKHPPARSAPAALLLQQ